jgi:hypothetical protein
MERDKLMKVITKYVYPSEGTRNGRVYPADVLEKAFSEPAFKELCTTKAIPVKSEYHDLIGYATANLEDDRVVTVDAEVFDPTYIKAIREAGDSIGFTLAGTGAVEYKDGGPGIVTEFNVDCAMLYSRPAVDCITKIYKED